MRKITSIFLLAFITFVPISAWNSDAKGQTYEEIERRAIRRLESDRALNVGDCSEAMLSWLGMRFTEEQRRRGKAREACADAQLFSYRNRIPFIEALPRVAEAHGGVLRPECPQGVQPSSDYGIYSGCRSRPIPFVPPPPSEFELQRRRDVAELGSVVFSHMIRCIPSSNVDFAFYVRQNGRIDNFGDGGGFGRIGPPPDAFRELRRIEQILREDTRCSVFPEILRGRYISISTENNIIKVMQVRNDNYQN